MTRFCFRARVRARRTRSRLPQAAIVAPAARVAFGLVVKDPLASFIRAILQPVRPAEREHFRERRGECGKASTASRAAPATSSERTPFWRWKSFSRAGTFKYKLRAARSRESREAPEMSFAAKRRSRGGERRVCGGNGAGKLAWRDSSVSGWWRSRRNRSNGRSSCRSRPTRGC